MNTRSDEKTRYTVCPYNCWPVNCGMSVIDEVGRLRIAGNPYHDLSRGRLCVKGQSAMEIKESPARVTKPLFRRGPRGSESFAETSWEEALSQIAERMQKNITAGRREANVLYHSHGNIVQRINWIILTPRFANLVGMTLWDGNFPCWYDVGVGQALSGYYGSQDAPDVGKHARAVVNWAQDPAASQANLIPYLLEVRDRGGKLITIDPRVTQTAALSDIHLRPRLGTDTWLANAVAHILIRDNAFDEQFVQKHGYGFERYRKWVAKFSPKEAARVCDLEKKEIETLARCFAELKPLAINLTRGALGKHRGGIQMIRAIVCLVPLSGNMGVRGGGALWGESFDWNLDLALTNTRPPGPYPVNNFTAIDDALNRGAVDVLLIVGGNPLSQWPHLSRLRKQLSRVGLIVLYDLFLNQTAREVGDIILPAACWLEELGLRTSGRRIYLMDQISPPPGQCRETSQWMNDLAHLLGHDDYFPWGDKEECLNACLDSPACRPATVALLRERPDGLPANIPDIPYADGVFDSPSKKFEFYSQRAEEFGLPPLPDYVAPLESLEETPKRAREFPLQLISARRNTHFHSFHDSHRAIRTLSALEPGPILQMHPKDALARGIKDGDFARLFNDRGSGRVRVELTTEVPRRHVSLNDCWPELNEVTPAFAPCPTAVTAELGMGGQPSYQNTLVEVKRD